MEIKVKLWALVILSSVGITNSFLMRETKVRENGIVKSSTYRSPSFTLGHGEVQDKFYYGIPFPQGHIALKGFDAEVVDEAGNSVPLSEVYLHHWVVVNFYTNSIQRRSHMDKSDILIIGNDGACPHHGVSQIFGLGSETRHTSTAIPDPYGIEVGDPDATPQGYEEVWLLNVHSINTIGTVDPSGCQECRCDLYNVTVDAFGHTLREGYSGGLLCCYDGTQCLTKDNSGGEKKTYYLQYTVHWMDWDESIVPVKVYIFDVTYMGKYCKVEYDISFCDVRSHWADCIDTKESHMRIPVGGDVIYAVAHQHAGGIGSTLYGDDGREICTSLPIYGNGSEAGNEAGNIVGMSTCYPKPGTVKVYTGENVRLLSNYSRITGHTGVMGLFYLLVDPHQNKSIFQHSIE